jgi:hypothetical protein
MDSRKYKTNLSLIKFIAETVSWQNDTLLGLSTKATLAEVFFLLCTKRLLASNDE